MATCSKGASNEGVGAWFYLHNAHPCGKGASNEGVGAWFHLHNADPSMMAVNVAERISAVAYAPMA